MDQPHAPGFPTTIWKESQGSVLGWLFVYLSSFPCSFILMSSNIISKLMTPKFYYHSETLSWMWDPYLWLPSRHPFLMPRRHLKLNMSKAGLLIMYFQMCPFPIPDQNWSLPESKFSTLSWHHLGPSNHHLSFITFIRITGSTLVTWLLNPTVSNNLPFTSDSPSPLTASPKDHLAVITNSLHMLLYQSKCFPPDICVVHSLCSSHIFTQMSPSW